MVVFHPSTLRGGDPTHHSETRRTLSLCFFGDDALVASRPGAKRTGKHGHPLNQVSVKRESCPFRREDFSQIC